LGFDPAAPGTRSASLHIADNSPDGGEIINVSGTASKGLRAASFGASASA